MGDLLSTHISIVRGDAPDGREVPGMTTYCNCVIVASNESAVPAPEHGTSGGASFGAEASNASADASIEAPPRPALPPPPDASTIAPPAPGEPPVDAPAAPPPPLTELPPLPPA